MGMMKDRKHVKSAWVSKKSSDAKQEKPWGHEKIWSGFNGIHGKSMFISSGLRTSLKYHPLKTEVLFLRSGKIDVFFGDEESILDPIGHPMKHEVMVEGDVLFVQSGSPYRITAIEDSEIIEIGNNLTDMPIRIEDDYGRDSDTKNT